MKFTVVLHTDDGQRYGVTVPDLPGCFSCGDTLDDALESVLETLLEDGGELLVRQPIGAHQACADYAGGVWAVVDPPVEKYFGPAEKINITVPHVIHVTHG